FEQTPAGSPLAPFGYDGVHTKPLSHFTVEHTSTHAPWRHACPYGHLIPMHSATHSPLRHTSPSLQTLSLHLISTQTPASASHAVPGTHANSPRAQFGTHVPR